MTHQQEAVDAEEGLEQSFACSLERKSQVPEDKSSQENSDIDSGCQLCFHS